MLPFLILFWIHILTCRECSTLPQLQGLQGHAYLKLQAINASLLSKIALWTELKFLNKTFYMSLINYKCSTTKPCHNSFITGRCSLDVCNQAWLRVNWTKELSYEVTWASLLDLQIVQCSLLHRLHQTHKWLDMLSPNNLVWKISPFGFLNTLLDFIDMHLRCHEGPNEKSFLVCLVANLIYILFCTWSHGWLILPLFFHLRWQICLEQCNHSRLCLKCRSVPLYCFAVSRFIQK